MPIPADRSCSRRRITLRGAVNRIIWVVAPRRRARSSKGCRNPSVRLVASKTTVQPCFSSSSISRWQAEKTRRCSSLVYSGLRDQRFARPVAPYHDQGEAPCQPAGEMGFAGSRQSAQHYQDGSSEGWTAGGELFSAQLLVEGTPNRRHIGGQLRVGISFAIHLAAAKVNFGYSLQKPRAAAREEPAWGVSASGPESFGPPTYGGGSRNRQLLQSLLNQPNQDYGRHRTEIQTFENWVDFAGRFPQQVSYRTQNRLRYRDQKHGNPDEDSISLASRRLQNQRQHYSGQDSQAQDSQQPAYNADDPFQRIPPYTCPSLTDFWYAAFTAATTVAGTPPLSRTCRPSAVVPPGETTMSLSSPGCLPVSMTSLVLP